MQDFKNSLVDEMKRVQHILQYFLFLKLAFCSNPYFLGKKTYTYFRTIRILSKRGFFLGIVSQSDASQKI